MLLHTDMLRAHQYRTGWAAEIRKPCEARGCEPGCRDSRAALVLLCPPSPLLFPLFTTTVKKTVCFEVDSQAANDIRLVYFCLEYLLEQKMYLGTRKRRKAEKLKCLKATMSQSTPSVMESGG